MSDIRIVRSEKDSIIVFKSVLGNEIPLYEFPPLLTPRCEICQAPTSLKYCRYHKSLEMNGFPRLIKSIDILGYYSTDFEGNPKNPLTKLIQKVKKEYIEEEIINIFTKVIKFRIKERVLDFNLITYVPSREKHLSLKKISLEVSRDYKLKLIPSEEFIILKNIGLTRDISDYYKRKEFVNEKFKKKDSIETDLNISGKLLIIDDIINTGWTVSKIASILKEIFPNLSTIEVFCLGKVLPKGKILNSNLTFK
ncbi:hypothetical protein LCGC14_0854610 [marine sediment metagenome]|uniref:Phosphoribosyltransferase domain-containing protein n=1 Tax=marine sediment metagenome TaxID=412755 RepID=A0A0F9RTU6_9ZZZZ